MALIKSTSYAPDIYKHLNGILLACKPSGMSNKELVYEFRNRITDELNSFKPRPLAKKLVITGGIEEEKNIVEVPNLADHPLVVGPRYQTRDYSMSCVKPSLGYRSSGLSVILVGNANRLMNIMNRAKMVSVYQVSGKFGYITDSCFHDGNVIDKCTFEHIRPWKLDSICSKIESSQRQRLFDSAKVPIQSQEAYELAKAWPSRPPKMAAWPVIYRLRCIHLKLPDFKLEITITNESEQYLGTLIHEVGRATKSAAYAESIRRVKFGPFDINDSLTDRDWDLQSILNNLAVYHGRYGEISEIMRGYSKATNIRTEHVPESLERRSKRTS